MDAKSDDRKGLHTVRHNFVASLFLALRGRRQEIQTASTDTCTSNVDTLPRPYRVAPQLWVVVCFLHFGLLFSSVPGTGDFFVP